MPQPVLSITGLMPPTSAVVAASSVDRTDRRADGDLFSRAPRAVGSPLSMPGAADLATFRAMLAGDLSTDEGMLRVARSGSWPIQTPSGSLVAVPANGRSDVTLIGEHNGWTPQQMTRQGNLLWAVIPTGGAYKLVEDGQAAADPWARSYRIDANGEMSLTRAFGAHFERWHQVGAPGLRPRDVRVWVPADRPTHHLYVQDGQNVFDGGWDLQDEVGPHTLVVAIDNTSDRMDEYTPWQDAIDGRVCGGNGERYADFISATLRPMVERRYGRAQKCGLMGASLGGLISMYQALRSPSRWDFAASLSGTLGWGAMELGGPTLIDAYAAAPVVGATLYMDSGAGPGGADNYEPTRRMADSLAAHGYRWNENLFHWHAPGARHANRDWQARVFRPLELFERL